MEEIVKRLSVHSQVQIDSVSEGKISGTIKGHSFEIFYSDALNNGSLKIFNGKQVTVELRGASWAILLFLEAIR